MRLRLRGPWLWGPGIFLADLASKRLVLAHAETLRGRVDVLGDLLRLAYVRNPGAAMGLLPAGREVLIAVSVLASVFLIALYLRTPPRLVVRRAALAAIVGGAFGNLVDRIWYGGSVVDFIDIGVGVHRFYTFNVADMGVSLGGAVLFLSLLRESRRGEPAATASPTPPAAPASADAEGARSEPGSSSAPEPPR